MRKLIEIITLFGDFSAYKLYSYSCSNTIKLVAITAILTMFCHSLGNGRSVLKNPSLRALRSAHNPVSPYHFPPKSDSTQERLASLMCGQIFDKSIALFLVLPSLLGCLASKIALSMQLLTIAFPSNIITLQEIHRSQA